MFSLPRTPFFITRGFFGLAFRVFLPTEGATQPPISSCHWDACCDNGSTFRPKIIRSKLR